MKEFEVLAHIGKTPSKNTKGAILKQYNSEVLRKILYYTYNPFLTYRVKQLDFPDQYNTVQPDVSLELFQTLDLLASHTLTPTQGKALVKQLMAKCTKDGAKWVAKIISGDLKIGISESTINKVFKKLVPTFKVPLANPIVEPKSGKSLWESRTWPMGIEIKEDGLRCIFICDGEKGVFKTREGHDLEALDYLVPVAMALRPGTKFVLDGEIVGSVYNPNCKVAKKNKEKGKNWVFAQGSSMARSGKGTYPDNEMRNHLEYKVWDIVDYDYFMSNGEAGICKPLKLRKTQLAGLFERRTSEAKGMSMMECVIVQSKEEAVEFFNKIIAAGGEGAMLKDLEGLYEFKRSDAWLKIKAFYPGDFRIIGAYEGTAGTKNEGSLGGLILGLDDDPEFRSECGTGIDDDLRLDMWFRYKRGELNGIVEVMYQEVTADKSLRLPIFIQERPDKNTTSLG